MQTVCNGGRVGLPGGGIATDNGAESNIEIGRLCTVY